MYDMVYFMSAGSIQNEKLQSTHVETVCPVQKLCVRYRNCVSGAETACPVQKLCARYRNCVSGTETVCPVRKLCVRYGLPVSSLAFSDISLHNNYQLIIS
jgi:hypothetical protein